MSKICPECGKSFSGSQGQKYCSYRCCKKHNRKVKEIKHPDPPKGVPIIRAFSCKECGHEVLVWERIDKRTVFCCSLCEKKYWKHNTSKSNKHRKGEIKLAKKIKRGKVCAGCGVTFRAKGGEEYCKTCREKGVTWGIE